MVITRKESNLDPSLPDKYLRHSQIIGCTANLLLCPVPQAKCSARASLLFRSLKSIQISGTDMYFMENWPEIRASPPTHPFFGQCQKANIKFLVRSSCSASCTQRGAWVRMSLKIWGQNSWQTWLPAGWAWGGAHKQVAAKCGVFSHCRGMLGWTQLFIANQIRGVFNYSKRQKVQSFVLEKPYFQKLSLLRGDPPQVWWITTLFTRFFH